MKSTTADATSSKRPASSRPAPPARRRSPRPPSWRRRPIKWRLQTYAGAALGPHVTKPAVDMFNKAAKGEMEIELYYADQLVPTGELFRAMQAGTIDAVQSDDDSMAAPVDISVFGGYFPFATKHILDVPVLFNQYGLADIWRDAYAKAGGVVWLSAAGQDPVPLQHQEAAELAGRPAGPAPLHLPDRRPLPRAVRRRAGVDALRGRRRSRCRPANSTACAGRASPRTTRSAGPT